MFITEKGRLNTNNLKLNTFIHKKLAAIIAMMTTTSKILSRIFFINSYNLFMNYNLSLRRTLGWDQAPLRNRRCFTLKQNEEVNWWTQVYRGMKPLSDINQ